MITAQFGSKKFEVSPNKIYTPDGISISESIDIEETERSGKKPSTSVKGIKLQSLSFEVKLDARFVSIPSELRWWKSTLLAKQSYDFTLGNYKIGRFYLTQYDVKDIIENRNGEYTKATLSLSFTEDGTYAGSNTINFKDIVINTSASSVKASASATTIKKFRVGSTVRPKSGTRWYYSAEGAINKTGKSGKATLKDFKITRLYKTNKAIHVGSSGWMRPEDVTVISY